MSWWKQFAVLLYSFVILINKSILIEAYKDYQNYKIYNVIARTPEQQLQLHELSKERFFDFFAIGRNLNEPTRVLVPPIYHQNFISTLQKHNIYHNLLVEDVSKVIAEEKSYKQSKSTPHRLPLTKAEIYEEFYRHEDINQHIEALAKMYPSRVYVKTFGKSYEKRLLKTVTITNGDGLAGKNVIYVDAAMHAREWITPSMALYIIDELVMNFEENSALLEHYDWVILPVINADGYEFSHTDDRYWRKTRKPNANSTECYGTDGNRNFGHEWGRDEGSSAEPCDQTYRGEHAFSEPETQIVRDILWSYGERCKFYLTIHSYGNYFLLPWGYTSEVPDNFFDMLDVAEAGALAITLTTGTIYSYGNTYNTIYPTSGDSIDYAAGALNIPLAITLELPGGGVTGFDPAVSQIEEFVTETWLGIKAMAKIVVEKY